MSELQPAQNNLSAICLAACGALPAPAAILGSAVPMIGAQRVVSRKLVVPPVSVPSLVGVDGNSGAVLAITASVHTHPFWVAECLQHLSSYAHAITGPALLMAEQRR